MPTAPSDRRAAPSSARRGAQSLAQSYSSSRVRARWVRLTSPVDSAAARQQQTDPLRRRYGAATTRRHRESAGEIDVQRARRI
jgi:hypothetical protein